MPPEDDPTQDESEEERFARFYDERRSREKAADDRKKRLKDMGLSDDILDAFADAVWDRGERRAKERREAEERADEPPSRKQPKTWFERTFIPDEDAG
jgi:hypothetical protein